MNKRWEILTKKSNDITEQLLINRKIKKEDWASFLNPEFNNLYDPFKMKGMRQAVARFEKALKRKETIGIFGDYDADGIPGAALLYEFTRKLGLNASVYIPTRQQGYGLNKEGIETLKKENVKLLFTVDLGIRNIVEIKYAQRQGIDVIILDHHEMGKEKPNCIIVNPKQKDDKYPFSELAATGVVFKFIQAYNDATKMVGESFLKWSLDLVAISTICDIVPLLSENRIIAKYGLIVLKKTRRIGLQALFREADILPENIGTYAVGFQIGPRLNAPGRMDHANESFFLLISKDRQEADELANKLNSINLHRQKELERVLKEAKEKVCAKKLHRKKIIVIDGKSWPQGIVGLVAGKLMEEYSRPVIVCEEKDGKLKGSARSIEKFNIIEALDSAKNYLTRYGGHKKAAGLSLEIRHLSHLYDKLLEEAESKLRDDDLVPKISIDAEIRTEDLTLKFLDKIQKFEPFGLGNPRPVFLLKNAILSNIKLVGKNNDHLSLVVNRIKAIGFGLGNLAQNLFKKNMQSHTVDVVFTLDEDNWRERQVQLKIMDFKLK